MMFAAWIRQRSACGLLLLVLLPTLMGSSGCLWGHLPRVKNPFAAPPPCVFKPGATKEEIVDHLNANASRLTAWQSSRMSVRLKQEGMLTAVEMGGRLAVQSPNHFRLNVSSVRGDEADFGSNAERFWFWVRESPQPAVMTASHQDLGVAQQFLPFPFEPKWVMEALGVTLLDPNDYEMQQIPGTERVNLSSVQISPAGQQVSKAVVVDLCSGRIIEQSLYDHQGNLVAKANMSDYRATGDGVAVPYAIQLEWPQAGTRMQLSLWDVDVNPSYFPEGLWQLPTNRGQVVDLGRAGRQQFPRPGFGQ